MVAALQDSPDAVYRWASEHGVLVPGAAAAGRRSSPCHCCWVVPCVHHSRTAPREAFLLYTFLPHTAAASIQLHNPPCTPQNALALLTPHPNQINTPPQHASTQCTNPTRPPPSPWRSTACTPLPPEEVALRQRVKCVTDQHGYVIYFSRGVIPHNKDGVVR